MPEPLTFPEKYPEKAPNLGLKFIEHRQVSESRIVRGSFLFHLQPRSSRGVDIERAKLSALNQNQESVA
jgi:hypothetical protein